MGYDIFANRGRGCWFCAHFALRGPGGDAVCTHPRYQVPTRWTLAIERGQPCGGDNAPLWERRVMPPAGAAHA